MLPRPRVSSLRASSSVGLGLWRGVAADGDAVPGAVVLLRTPTSSPALTPVSPLMLPRVNSSASLVDLPPLSASTSDRKVSSSSPAAAAARNPISLRLYKVLAANFEDDATREALRTLSDFYQPTADADKGKQPVRDVEDVSALHLTNGHAAGSKILPAVSTGVAVRARKNLRRDVELRLAECSQQFLSAFGEVDEVRVFRRPFQQLRADDHQKLDVLNTHVAQMRAKCDEIQAQLQASNDACKYLLERAEGLQTQRQSLTARSELVNSFLKRFTLTPAESDAMVSRDVPVGQTMFDAMDRTEKIRDDCRVLLSGESGESQAGYASQSHSSLCARLTFGLYLQP